MDRGYLPVFPAQDLSWRAGGHMHRQVARWSEAVPHQRDPTLCHNLPIGLPRMPQPEIRVGHCQGRLPAQAHSDMVALWGQPPR